MNSMTGHGRAKISFDGRQLTVEIGAVNRKQIEIFVTLPRELTELEPRLREEISSAISRGRIAATVTLSEAPGAKSRAIDFQAAYQYHQQLKKLAHKLGINETVPLKIILAGPGVLTSEATTPDPNAVWPHLRKATRAALQSLLAMRKREGAALARDCAGRFQKISHATARVAKLAPGVVERYRDSLRERIRKAGLEIDLADERLLKEIALYADRCDISEELTRLKSHFQQAATLLAKNEPVGRTLDFLIQEMNREVNTIGSKANDLAISRAVVDMKTGLEKIREQVQNIE